MESVSSSSRLKGLQYVGRNDGGKCFKGITEAEGVVWVEIHLSAFMENDCQNENLWGKVG